MSLIAVPRHVFVLGAIVAAMLACARPASAANPCGGCPSGQCCDVAAGPPNLCVDATGGPTHCIAPDGVCQAPGEDNCFCCNSSNTCVDSCPSGQCCDVTGERVCMPATGPPVSCLAPDGVCQAPGANNCACCNSSNTCVDACGGTGACVDGSCVFPAAPVPIVSDRVAIGLTLTVCALGVLRLRRDHRRAR